MSSTAAPVPRLSEAPSPARRVRHVARETAALMMFSAGASTAMAILLLLVVSLGR
jgi:hypothetical protein